MLQALRLVCYVGPFGCAAWLPGSVALLVLRLESWAQNSGSPPNLDYVGAVWAEFDSGISGLLEFGAVGAVGMAVWC